MTPDGLEQYDYDGFGAPVLQLLNCFVHEHGAWRWRVVDPSPENPSTRTPTHVREALPQEDLERLREKLARSLEVVERQIGGRDDA